MKNTLLTIALFAGFSAFAITPNQNDAIAFNPSTYCEGGHECNDKCKKDKEGKCAEAATKENKKGEANKACCKKGESSCHGKKAKTDDKEEVKPTGSLN